MGVKRLLFRSISGEQISFFEGRQIHEAIGVAREGFHSIREKKLLAMVVRLDLSKEYDRVS
jgi:hypothetical protein